MISIQIFVLRVEEAPIHVIWIKYSRLYLCN